MTTKEALFLRVMEECNEVSQRASKILNFGLQEQQSAEHNTNEVRFWQEYFDLVAVMEMLVEKGIINELHTSEIEELKKTKKEKVEKFLDYSRSIGTVSDGNGIKVEWEVFPYKPAKTYQVCEYCGGVDHYNYITENGHEAGFWCNNCSDPVNLIDSKEWEVKTRTRKAYLTISTDTGFFGDIMFQAVVKALVTYPYYFKEKPKTKRDEIEFKILVQESLVHYHNHNKESKSGASINAQNNIYNLQKQLEGLTK